jgi:hypothetical protein
MSANSPSTEAKNWVKIPTMKIMIAANSAATTASPPETLFPTIILAETYKAREMIIQSIIKEISELEI